MEILGSSEKVVDEFAPDRILIEPSGVGKLSDVIRAVERTSHEVPMELGSAVTVVNAQKSKMYLKNFGEFFLDQVEHAGTIVLSRTADLSDEKLEQTVSMLKEHNPKAAMITTPWDQIDGKQILAAMQGHTLLEQLLEEARLHSDDEEHEHHHHHDHEEHEHHRHHHDDEEHDHHHHHEDEEHEHHHDHEEHEHHHPMIMIIITMMQMKSSELGRETT